jgi:hypothetical protein
MRRRWRAALAGKVRHEHIASLGSIENGAGSASPHAGLQVRAWSRKQYNAKLNTVAQIVDGVVKSLARKN